MTAKKTEAPAPLKIIELHAENVKRLHCVEVRPDDALVVVGGANGAGKSSVLDAIEYAIGGQGRIPDEPVRRGATKARVVLDLDEIIVERVFRPGGDSTLVVKSKDGAKLPSPQAVLDRLYAPVAFDPLEFARMEPTKQADVLRRLVGIDFSEIDRERQKVYDERTEAGREAKRLRAQLEAVPVPLEIPEKPADVKKLTEALEKAVKGEARRAEIAARRKVIVALIGDLDTQISNLRDKQAVLQAEDAKIVLEAEKMPNPANIGAMKREMAQAQTTNEAIRVAGERKRLDAETRAAETKVAELTRRVEECDEEKRRRLGAARFPVDGLTLDQTTGAVVFKDLPFEQASGAERLRVSVAVGLATNPRLKVLLVRDGSLLDDDGLRLLYDLASKAGAQVWVERVGKGEEVTVLLEDGAVVER